MPSLKSNGCKNTATKMAVETRTTTATRKTKTECNIDEMHLKIGVCRDV